VMRWAVSHKADPRALPLANRHYNRQSPDSKQFMPPGRGAVLLTQCERALWITSAPQFARHDWKGAWVNTLFRNEGAGLSSELITEAIAASLVVLGPPPPLGIVTFVDAKKTRHKRDPGRCYRKAGFRHVGFTKVNKLYVFQLTPDAMPLGCLPIGWTQDLFKMEGN